MIKDFEIKNFRGIQSLKLEGFSNVNIFVGKPNTGKTSILEALHLFLCWNPEGLFAISDSRGMLKSARIFNSLFYGYNVDKDIVLKAQDNEIKIAFNQSQKINVDDKDKGHRATGLIFKDNKSNKMQINRESSTQFEVHSNKNNRMKTIEYISCVPSIRYNNLVSNLAKITEIRETRDELSEACKNFSDDIITMRFNLNNRLMVEKKNLSQDIDLRLMGNGFQSYISILSSILFKPQYILIDEIENGLHFENIDSLLEAILKASNNVQFFITTHNEELLKHLSTLLEDRHEESVSVFNVYIDKDFNIQVGRYSQKNFVFNIEHNNEMRD